MSPAELAFTDHLSHSQVYEFLMCGELYRRHRIEGVIPPGNLGMTAGKAFHEATAYLWGMQKTGEMLDEAAVKKLYDEAWINAPYQSLHPRPTLEEWQKSKDNMWPLAKATFEKYKGIITPDLIEHEFRIEVGKMPVLGFFDMVTKDGVIIDWKTGAKTPADSIAATSQQLTLYDYAYRNLFGKKPKALMIIFARMTAKGPVSVEFVSEPRPDETFERLERRFGMLEQTLAHDGPWLPASDGHWKCSAKQCSFYSDCKVRA